MAKIIILILFLIQSGTVEASEVRGYLSTGGQSGAYTGVRAEAKNDYELKRGADRRVFLVMGGKKCHLKDQFELRNFHGRQIQNVPQSDLDRYADTTCLDNFMNNELIRGKDMKVYAIKQNKKEHVINWKELNDKYKDQRIWNVRQAVAEKY